MKLTFDGFGLNDAADPYKARVLTFAPTVSEDDRANMAAILVAAPAMLDALVGVHTNRDGQIVHRAALERVEKLLAADLLTAAREGAVRSETEAPYTVTTNKHADDDAAIERAIGILALRLHRGSALTSPGAVRDYLRLSIGARDHEVFVCVWLDAQHRVIACEEVFRGTLNQTSVYPREVVKGALAANAAAVIFAHNHPSGSCAPSQADEYLTRRLKEALALIEVPVLDHFIVTHDSALSFAERGLL